jgi:hypothetical protein
LLGVVPFAVIAAAVSCALRGPVATPSSRAVASVLVGFGTAMLIKVGAFFWDV